MLDGVGFSWPGGSPENTGLILALIVGAYFVVLWFSAVVWTARDIHQRTSEPLAQVVFTLIVLIFNFPGLVVYRVLRPPLTLQEAEEYELESSALRQELEPPLVPICSGCERQIADDYLACPNCSKQLRRACEHCERALELDWETCPWCAKPVAVVQAAKAAQAAPAAKQTPPPGEPPVRSAPRRVAPEAARPTRPPAPPAPSAHTTPPSPPTSPAPTGTPHVPTSRVTTVD